MNTTDDELLALAKSVGVVTIPNPKPRTLLQRVNAGASTLHDVLTEIEHDVLDFVGRIVVTDRYVGRHRMQPVIDLRPPVPRPPTFLRRLMNAGTRFDLRVLATLESIGQPPQDVQKALANIRDTADRARRDISFFHAYINGMTDIGERGVQCSS